MKKEYKLELLIVNNFQPYSEDGKVKHFSEEEKANFIIPKEMKQYWPEYIALVLGYRWVELPQMNELYCLSFSSIKGYNISKTNTNYKADGYTSFETADEAFDMLEKKIKDEEGYTREFLEDIERLEKRVKEKYEEHRRHVERDTLIKAAIKRRDISYQLPNNLTIRI